VFRRLARLAWIVWIGAACAAPQPQYWRPPTDAAPPVAQVISVPVVVVPTAVSAPSTPLNILPQTAAPSPTLMPEVVIETPTRLPTAEGPYTPAPELLTAIAQASQGAPTLTPQPPAGAALTPGVDDAPPPGAVIDLRPKTPTVTPELADIDTAPLLYYAQSADTLHVVATRFGVQTGEITSPEAIPPTGFINPGQLLIVPHRLANVTSDTQLIPDSEFVYSPSAANFDTLDFVAQAGGYLSTYQEWHKSTGMKSGAEILERVALENSVNPRLLLALLEYHSHWVYSQPQGQNQLDYPMGLVVPTAKGLYNQLVWAVNKLSTGYYAYREGRLTHIQFKDGSQVRLAPDLNAGSAGLQYYFAQHGSGQDWVDALSPQNGLPALLQAMFGDPWERARGVEPLFPPGAAQPALVLPFMRNWTWSFTGGPHGAWEQEGAYAALDFAPGAQTSGCVDTPTYAVAAAAGLVTRTGPGLVVIDLDGDGHEQTGWVLVYLHIAEKERVQKGQWVAQGDVIGKPSCEGGLATGTHLHLARKFNGEWIPAYGPLPFNLGGWVSSGAGVAYKGTLTRGDQTLLACTCANYLTYNTRTDTDP
jgi:murein DD-endopeptidase MepM/ murein hydrolase activator NlpD